MVSSPLILMCIFMVWLYYVAKFLFVCNKFLVFLFRLHVSTSVDKALALLLRLSQLEAILFKEMKE